MTIIINLFILLILKIVLGWNMLNSPTCYVHVSPEWLQIMLILGNIGLGFFLMNFLHVYVVITLLRQKHIFYMGVYNIKSLGTPKECPIQPWAQSRDVAMLTIRYLVYVPVLLKMLLYLLNSIQKFSVFKNTLHKIWFLLNLLLYLV